MPSRISGRHRTAFVTGAASGLGEAFVEMLIAEGVGVWGTSRVSERLAPLVSRFPSRFTPVVLDLADAPAAEEAFLAAAGETGGAFDLVVNNAGFGVFGEFAEIAASTWQAQIGAMLGGTLRIAHAAYRAMRARRRGCLVNVSSLAVEFPLPYMSGYNVAKAGLSALSESLIFESMGTEVTVIDFRPGDYRTEFLKTMTPHSTVAKVPPRVASAWSCFEAFDRSAPPPRRAAADLRVALVRNRSGVVRSGGFFQARLAPLLARMAPGWLLRAATNRYFSHSDR